MLYIVLWKLEKLRILNQYEYEYNLGSSKTHIAPLRPCATKIYIKLLKKCKLLLGDVKRFMTCGQQVIKKPIICAISLYSPLLHHFGNKWWFYEL